MVVMIFANDEVCTENVVNIFLLARELFILAERRVE